MQHKSTPFRMKGISRLGSMGCVALLAKSLTSSWISAGTQAALPLIDNATRFQALGDCGLALSPAGSEPVIIQRMTLEEKAEIVVTPRLDLRVLRGSRDQGGRRHLRFWASSRVTEFEDRPHLGSRATKEFLTSIRDGSSNLENYHTNWCAVAESRRVVPSVTRMLSCASLSGCSSATIK